VDEILLELPPERQWFGVAHMVLSGLAARLDMTVEMLEEWRLALDELFARQHGERAIEIAFRASPESLELRFCPASEQLVTELESEGEGVDLRRVLSALSDKLEIETSGDDRVVVLRRAVSRPSGVE
jgi:hypothetical protein